MTHKKPHLPPKICPVCQRQFAWRKKWARHWAQVKYCSQKCRAKRHLSSQQTSQDKDKS